MQGEKVPGYREEKDVKPDSNTETFAAVKFFIDNWRWQGVPFYVRTGKHLHEKTTVLSIQFKPAPAYAFPKEAAETWRPNRLTISIAPEMDICLRFQAKRPGQTMILSPVDMIFNYKDEYDGEEPEAYETLLYDVMEGDANPFYACRPGRGCVGSGNAHHRCMESSRSRLISRIILPIPGGRKMRKRS